MYSAKIELAEGVATLSTEGVPCTGCGKTFKNKASLRTHKYNTCKSKGSKPQNTREQTPSISSKHHEDGRTKRGYHRTAPPTQLRAHRCGTCSACTAPDCRECKYCLDKAKYGGRNILKRPCQYRTCRNLVREKSGDSKEDVKDAVKDDDAFNSDDEAYWKEFCAA